MQCGLQSCGMGLEHGGRDVDVVGVGLNATDTLIHVGSFPARGAKVAYETEVVQPGGQVASAIVACQTWGLRTRYIGKLGDDDAARLHWREFERVGVEARVVTVPGAPSLRSLILVDTDGERTVLNRHDRRLRLQPEELSREWVSNARVLLVDGFDTEAATLAATWAREEGVPVVADIDEVYPGVEELLHRVDYLIVSRDFPERLTGERDLQTALQQMHARFGCRLTAATLGAEGVFAWDGNTFCHACAYEVKVEDTTGAGDVFHAGFVYALLQDWTLRQRLDFACAAAALNCTAEGARGGIGPLSGVEALMATGVRCRASLLALPELAKS